jgi:hypothetical protein
VVEFVGVVSTLGGLTLVMRFFALKCQGFGCLGHVLVLIGRAAEFAAGSPGRWLVIEATARGWCEGRGLSGAGQAVTALSKSL